MSASPPPAVGVVLVHGGLHTPWCWHRVTERLACPFIAVELPGRGKREAAPTSVHTRDFVAATVADLAEAGFNRAVVVAHSLGGITALGLCAAVPDRIAHAVFISAVVPKPGARPVDDLPAALRWFAAGLMRRQWRRTDGAFTLPRTIARHMFCSDLDTADTAAVLEHCVRETPAIALDRAGADPLPDSIGRTYVRLTRDRALWPWLQKRMIANIPPVDVIAIDAGHDVMLSQPQRCAEIINAIVAQVCSTLPAD